MKQRQSQILKGCPPKRITGIIMKRGTLFYDEECGRYNFKYQEEDGERNYGGIHCGGVFEFILNDVWVPARVEMYLRRLC